MNHKEVNILFLFWGRKGGGAKYSYEIARQFTKMSDVNLHLSISNQCEIREEFNKLGAPIHSVDTYTNLPGYFYRLTIGRSSILRKLQSYLSKNKIEILIIGMDFFWGPLIYKACKQEGVKSILVVHEPKPHPKENLLMSVLKKQGLEKSIRGADHLVTLTEHVRKYVEEQYRIGKPNITVIPHGIFSYYKAFRPKELPENEKVRILYFGRIEYYKGLDILLKAFSLLENKYDFIRLEIWGSGDISRYQDLISDLKSFRIENRWIDEAEITEVFRKSHICILPYRDASQSGIAGIASSAAMPIVACPAEGLKEQLEKAGAIISKDFTPQSLANSIEELLLNPGYYSSISSKALQYAEDISWLSIAEKFKRLSDQLIQVHKV